MKLVFATRNAHKHDEVRAILAGEDLELLGLDHWPELGEIPEDHDTFELNALQKAHVVHAATGLPTVADDSGLEVDSLDGRPGVFSKRFSHEGTDTANNARLLRELDGVVARKARFRCVLALVWAEGARTVDGRCEGTIALSPRGEGGFGYDPLFLPDAAPGKAMAELSADQKNAISHRGLAFAQLPGLLGAVHSPAEEAGDLKPA